MGTPGRALPIGDASPRVLPARPAKSALLRHGLAALLCLGLMMPAGAAADPPPSDPGNLEDLSLEDLMNVRVERIVSASRYEQKVTQAPASVTIITVAQIRQFGYRTLADILRSVPGLFVTYD